MRIFDRFKTRRDPPKKEEKRLSVQVAISDYLRRMFSSTGVAVGEESVTGHPTVWRCLELIAGTIAGLPIELKERQPDGSILRIDHPALWTLAHQPNKWQTAFVFWDYMLRLTLIKGNAYALISTDDSGYPEEYLPVKGDDVELKFIKNELWYYIKGRAFMPEEVLHLKGPTLDGYQGCSILEYHRRTFSSGLSMNEYIRNFFENDATPKSVISFDGQGNEDMKREVKAEWMELYGGLGGDPVAFLDGGMKFERVSLPPSDALYLDSAQFNDRQICNIFGVPLPMVNDLSDSHYNNIEHTKIQFTQFTLMSHINRIESEINSKILTRADRRNRYFDYDTHQLLRGDMKTRAEYYAKMRQMEAMSANDVRKAEGWNPRTDPEGDSYANPNINTTENTTENEKV
jgi:HK97 family phage portal protein